MLRPVPLLVPGPWLVPCSVFGRIGRMSKPCAPILVVSQGHSQAQKRLVLTRTDVIWALAILAAASMLLSCLVPNLCRSRSWDDVLIFARFGNTAGGTDFGWEWIIDNDVHTVCVITRVGQ